MATHILPKFILIYLFFLGGCASFDSGDTVLERSANFRPYWVNSDVKIEKDKDISIVYSVSDIHRLDVGVKQAEFEGKSEISNLVLQKILRSWKLPSGPLGDKISSEAQTHWQSRNKLDRDIPSTFKATYWEYKEVNNVEGPQTYYEIWSLFNVKYWIFQDYSCGLLRNLSLSSDKELSTFAKEKAKDCNLDAE
jgi:hypothetical protein